MQDSTPDGEMSDYVEYLQRAFEGSNKDGVNLSELFNEDVSDSNWKQTELLLNKLEQQDTRPVIEYLMRTPIGRLSMARMSAKAQEYIEDTIEPDAERITMEQRIKLSAILNILCEMFAYLGANKNFFEKGEEHGTD